MSSILDRVAPVSESPPAFKMCLFGPPGSGKTVKAAEAPKPLVLDVEGSARSLLNHSWTRDTPVAPVKSTLELEDLIFDARDGKLDEYETLIIDTFSELEARSLSERLIARHRIDSSKYDPYTPQMLDYKWNGERLRRLTVALFDLPHNVILVVHDTEQKDDEDGKIYIRPGLAPKLAKTVRGLMHVTGYLTSELTEGGEFRQSLQVHPTGRVQAKCRVGGLPVIIQNPNLEDIFKANVEMPVEEAETIRLEGEEEEL